MNARAIAWCFGRAATLGGKVYTDGERVWWAHNREHAWSRRWEQHVNRRQRPYACAGQWDPIDEHAALAQIGAAS